MSEQSTAQKNKIIAFIESKESDYWKTIDEISSGTKIDVGTVSQILTNSEEFVRSSYRVKVGEPVYTTRNMFRNKAPFIDKVIGAFKNRID